MTDSPETTESAACAARIEEMKNPYFTAGGIDTQTSDWLGGWTCAPSAYAVVVRHTEDVVAAVNFARDNNLRLVVKGGGHSYQGTSNAADSLLIWTREMHEITLHDAFAAEGCVDTAPPASGHPTRSASRSNVVKRPPRGR